MDIDKEKQSEGEGALCSLEDAIANLYNLHCKTSDSRLIAEVLAASGAFDRLAAYVRHLEDQLQGAISPAEADKLHDDIEEKEERVEQHLETIRLMEQAPAMQLRELMTDPNVDTGYLNFRVRLAYSDAEELIPPGVLR